MYIQFRDLYTNIELSLSLFRALGNHRSLGFILNICGYNSDLDIINMIIIIITSI